MAALLTHIALHVTDIDRSIAFYTEFLGMRLAHRRLDETTRQATAWVTTCEPGAPTEFVIVLLAGDPALFGFEGAPPQSPMGPITHFGISVDSREEVDEFARRGIEEGILSMPATFINDVIGYICFVKDPDGHSVEISYGQDLELT